MAAQQPYYIGPFDELTIDVFGVEDLSARDVQVDASGRLGFPLVGAVEAGGRTPSEIATDIENGLRRRFVRDPHVTVNLKRTVSQVVTVEGEVREPGLYPVIGRTTLLRAIASAKGTTEYSKLDDVVIFRTVGGQKYAALYNLKQIRSGAYADPEVYANDVVMVGESRGRRVFRDLLAVVPLLTYPLIVALQN
jgi:polysaccharide export outer membrane protein